jgi:hypothetical protein
MLTICLFISIVSIFISLVLLIGYSLVYSKTQGNKTTMKSQQINEKSMDYIREQEQKDLFKNTRKIIEDEVKRSLYDSAFKTFFKKDNNIV